MKSYMLLDWCNMTRRMWALIVQANQYWRYPFRPVMGSRQLVEFVVLDVETVGRTTDRMVQADVQVRLAMPVGPMQSRG